MLGVLSPRGHDDVPVPRSVRAVLTRALGMLEQGLAARQRGQRLGIYDAGSQRFTDVVI